MNQLRIKQGSTFLVTIQVFDANGAPIDTTTCTFACQLRSSTGALVATVGVTPTPGVLGQATLLSQPEDTATWPAGLLQGDLIITTSGLVVPTETFVVYVMTAITGASPS